MSKWFLIVLTVVGLLSVGFAAAAETPNLAITIPTVTAPNIDGDLSDQTWLEASTKGGKAVVDTANDGSMLTPYPRVAYVGYDTAGLYVAFVTFSSDASKLVGDMGNWWDNDEVEIFLDPGKTGSIVQFGITSKGAQSAEGIKSAVKIDGNRWTVEVAIPWEAAGGTPKAGDQWGFNLNGHQVADGDIWVAWNCTYGGFHNAARFATATFGE